MKFPPIIRRKTNRSPRSKWRKSFLIIAGLVLLAAGPTAYVLLRTPSNAQAAWFDNSWAFRQKMPITNTTGTTQTGFQLQLSIDTATLITGGKLQSSCQDVRITNSSGKQLPFWIEPNTCNTSATKVWVKADSIPTASSGSSADIYFYYGNAAASAASYTASNVFIRDTTGDSAVWPLDDTTTTQSYSNVYNPAVATGRNIILNGTFDDTSQWTSVSGFAISGGTANFVSCNTLTGDGATFNLVTPNKMYAITYTVSNYSAGTIRARAGSGSSGAGTARSANGTYTDTVLASIGTSTIYLDPTGFTGSVDNVTAVELNTVASGATVNQLLVDGNMEASGTSSWTSVNSPTLTKPTDTPHGGTRYLHIAQNVSTFPGVKQDVLTIGQLYRLTGYFRGNGSNTAYIQNGVTVLASTTSSTWTPFDVTIVATAIDVTMAANSTGYADFDDVTAALDTGIRTTELAQDPDMEASGTSYWSSQNATLTKETSSPPQGAQFLRATYSSNNFGVLQNFDMAAGKKYVVSGQIKVNSATSLSVYMGGGTVGSISATTSWQPFSVTGTADGVSSNRLLILKVGGTGGDFIDIDSLSLREVTPMVAIPANGVTLGSASSGHLTNAYTFDGTNDFVNLFSSDLNSTFSPTEGTLVVWAKVSSSGIWTDGAQHYLMILQADASNQIYIRKQTTNNQLTLNYSAGGTNKFVTDTSAPTGWFQVAMTWSKSNDQLKIYMNGAQTGATQTGLGTWVGNFSSTASILGAASTAANVPWSGMVNDVHLYSRALEPSEIADLYGNGTIDRQAYYTNNYSGHELIRLYNANVTVGAAATEEVGTNPAGWWKFNEGTGQAAQDSSSNRINGTLGATSASSSDDPTWATEDMCVSGKCLKFDGTNDVVNVGDVAAARLGNTGTVQAWVKPNAYPGASSWSSIITKGSWGSGRNYYSIYYQNSSSALRFDIGGSSAANPISVSNTLTPLNTWSHVAMTWDGTTIRAYVNGKQVGTTTQTQTPDTSTSSLQFGSITGSQFLNGFIDEPKIFSYARTAAQIQVDYSSGASSVGSQSTSALTNGLVGYWKLDETSGAGAALADSSGNNNTGTAKLFGGGNTSTDSAHVVGKFGNSFSFDGGDDNIDIPYASNLTAAGSVSLSAWIKPTTIGGADYIFSNVGQSFRFLMTGSTAVQFPTACGAMPGFSSPIQTGVWQLLTGTFDVTTGQTVLYINGAKVSSGICTGAIVDTGNLSIGGTSTRRFNGSIDEMRMYNRALSSAEVQQLYNYAPGPVGEWRFEEGTGSSVADTSGYGSTGTWNGTLGRQWTQGKYGKGGLFNGSDNYVSVSTSTFPNPTTAITLETWVNITANKNWNNFIFRDGWFTNGKTAFNFYSDSSGIARLGISTSSSTSFEAVTSALSVNTWYHLAGTYDGSNIRMYVNGVLQSTTAASNLTFSTLSTLNISDAASNKLNGKLDEVKIYNYARSASQIQEDMRGNSVTNGEISTVAGPAAQTKPGSAVAYWKFDEGYGTTANNYGSANNSIAGTLTNMASPATSTSGWNNSGKVNKTLNFDGTNDYVTIPSSSLLSPGTGGFSVSAWIKTSATYAGGTGWIFSNYGSVSNNLFGMTVSTANKFSCLARDGSGNIVQPSPGNPVVNDGVWHHVTCTYNAGTMNMYVDGKLSATATNASIGTIDTTGVAKTIGTFANGVTTQNFTGQIDELKVYNFALTQDQVNSDFNQNLTQNFGVTEIKEAATDLTDGAGNDPVASWGFDEKTGTTANDSSGHGNTGTLTNGPTWTQGKVAQAIKFDGVDDYVNVPSATNMTPATSVSFGAWIKSNPNGVYGSGSNAGIIAKKSSWGGLWIPTNGGLITARITNSSGVAVTNGITTLIPGAWTHVFVVADASTSTIYYYINGKVFTTAAYNGTLQVGTDALTIGQQAGEYFNGIIDDVKIYDYARTASQVAYDYNRGAPVAWWKMDECQGTTLNDSSGNGSTGTIITPATGTQTLAGTCNTAGTAWGNGATGKYNASVNFDGSDDYATVPNPSVDDFGTGPMSVSVWVKTTTTAIAQIIDNKTAGSNAAGFNLGVNLIAGNGRVMWRVANGTTQISTGTTTDASIVNDGNWHHLVGVYARGTTNDSLLLYKDGKLAQSNTLVTAGWNISTSANMLIGAYLTSAGAGNFPGQIDDVRLFNYALSQNQVNKLYNENVSVLYGPVTGSP